MRAVYWLLALLLVFTIPVYAYQPPTCKICTKTYIILSVDYTTTPATAVATLYGAKIDYTISTLSVEQIQQIDSAVKPEDFKDIGLKVDPLPNERLSFFIDSGEGTPTEICAGGVTTDSNAEARCQLPANFPARRFIVYANYSGRKVGSDEAIFASESNRVVYAVRGLPVAFDLLADGKCLGIFVILGVLVAGMYAAGKNPLNAFDISTPKLPKPKKVGFRRVFLPIGALHTKRDQLRSILETTQVIRALTPEIRARLRALNISEAEIDRIVNSKANEFDKALALRALLAGFHGEIDQILGGRYSVKEVGKAYRERELAKEFEQVAGMEAEILRGKVVTREIEELMYKYDREIRSRITQVQVEEKRGVTGAKERLKAYNELFERLRALQNIAHAREVGVMALQANRRGYGTDGLILGNAEHALDMIALAPQIYVKNTLKPKMVKLVGGAAGPLVAEAVRKVVDVPVTAFDFFIGMPARAVISAAGIGKLQTRFVKNAVAELGPGKTAVFGGALGSMFGIPGVAVGAAVGGAMAGLARVFGNKGELVVGRAYPALKEVDLQTNYRNIIDILRDPVRNNGVLGPLSHQQQDGLNVIERLVANGGNKVTGDVLLAIKFILAKGMDYTFDEGYIRKIAGVGLSPKEKLSQEDKLDLIRKIEDAVSNNRGSILNDAYVAGYNHTTKEGINDSIMQRVRLTIEIITNFAEAELITGWERDLGKITGGEGKTLLDNFGKYNKETGTFDRWALEKAERLVRRECLEINIRGFLEELRQAGKRVLNPLDFKVDEFELKPAEGTWKKNGEEHDNGLRFYTEESYKHVRERLKNLGVDINDAEWKEIVKRADEKATRTIAERRFEGTYNTLQAIVGARFGIEAITKSKKYKDEDRVKYKALIEGAYDSLIALDFRRQFENLLRDASITDALDARQLKPGQEITYETAKKSAWIATPDMEWIPYYPGMKLGLADTPINAAVNEKGEVVTVHESLKKMTMENFVFKLTDWLRTPVERALLAGTMEVAGDLWKAKVTQEIHRERLLYIRDQMAQGQLPTLFGAENVVPSFSLRNIVQFRSIIGDLEKVSVYLAEMRRIVKKEFKPFGCANISEAETEFKNELKRCNDEGEVLSQQFKNLKTEIDTYNTLKGSLDTVGTKLKKDGIEIYDELGQKTRLHVDITSCYDLNTLQLKNKGVLDLEISKAKERLDEERDKVHREWEILSPLYEVALGFHRMQRSITATIYKTPRMTYGGYGIAEFGPGVFPFGPMAYDEPPFRAFMGVQPLGKALGLFLGIPFQLGRIGGSLTRPFAVLSGGLPDLRDMDLAMQKHPNMTEAYSSLWQFWKFWNFRYPEFKRFSKAHYYLREEESMAKPEIASTSGWWAENLIGEWGLLKSPADTKEEAIHELPWFLRFTASGVSGYPLYTSTWGGRSWNPFGRRYARRGEYAEKLTGHGPMLGTDVERVIPEQLAGTRGVRAAASRGNRLADFAGTTLIDPVNSTAFQYYRWGHLVTEAERRSANFDIFTRNIFGESLIKQRQEEKAAYGPFAHGYELMWGTLSPVAAGICLLARNTGKKYLMNTKVGKMLRVYPQSFCQRCGNQTTMGQPCSACSYLPTISKPYVPPANPYTTQGGQPGKPTNP